MSELLVGTLGWLGEDWGDDYYPDNLPKDWRFCYYSNNFRTVLVTTEIWNSHTEEEISDWLEDCDTGFRFVVQYSPDFSISDNPKKAVDAFIKKMQGIESQWDAILLSVSADKIPDRTQLAPWLDALLAFRPVCIDFEPPLDAAPDWLAEYPVTISWDSVRTDSPLTVGGESSQAQGLFTVAWAEESEPRMQRQIIETLASKVGKSKNAALFFRGKKAAYNAEKARLIGEMLGV